MLLPPPPSPSHAPPPPLRSMSWQPSPDCAALGLRYPHRGYEPEEQPETPQADAPPSIDHEHPMPGRGLQFLEMKDRREFSRNLQGAFEQTEEGIDIDEQVADEQGARIGAGSSNTNHDDDV